MGDVIAAAANLWGWLVEHDSFSRFYGDELRQPLFSGFLTLAGFLFTVKTFLIVRLQQDVYSDSKYQAWFREAQKYNSNVTAYGSLKRLAALLFFASLMSFATALTQMTIGLAGVRATTWIAIATAVFTAVLFGVVLYVVRRSVREWIKFWEEHANESLEAASRKPPKKA